LDFVCYSDNNYKPLNKNDAARRERFKSTQKSSMKIAYDTFEKSVRYFDIMLSILAKVQTFDDPNIDIDNSDVMDEAKSFNKEMTGIFQTFSGDKIGTFDVGHDETAGTVGYIVDTDGSLQRELLELNADDETGHPIIKSLGKNDKYSAQLNWLTNYNSLIVGMACAMAVKNFIEDISAIDDSLVKRDLIFRLNKIMPNIRSSSDDVYKFKIFLEDFDDLVDKANEAADGTTEEPKTAETSEKEPEESKEQEEPEEKEKRLEVEEKAAFAEINNMYGDTDDESLSDVKSFLEKSGYGMLVYEPSVSRKKFQQRRYEEIRGRKLRRSSVFDTADFCADLIPGFVHIVFKEDASQEMRMGF